MDTKEYKSCGTCPFFDCGMDEICEKCEFHNIENDFTGNCFNCKHSHIDLMDFPCSVCDHIGNDDNQDMWEPEMTCYEDPYGLCETCKHSDSDDYEYPCSVCGHLQHNGTGYYWEAK